MKYSTTKESYSEVFEIINFLGDEYKKQIPKKLYKFIENNRDKSYKPKFNLENNIESLNENSVSKKTVAIIAFLNSKYWTQDEETKQKLEKIYSADQERFQESVIEDYDDELLCNSGPALDTEENMLPDIYKEKWYRRIIKKIKLIFMRYTKNKRKIGE
ncbi:MAG: hypothetical protein J6J60_09005 [Clostridia bacterium]|nr:hypothetical protein [Clostridia bacterium]